MANPLDDAYRKRLLSAPVSPETRAKHHIQRRTGIPIMAPVISEAQAAAALAVVDESPKLHIRVMPGYVELVAGQDRMSLSADTARELHARLPELVADAVILGEKQAEYERAVERLDALKQELAESVRL